MRFRQRLVALIDELLDEPPPPGESFLLDGQAIVVEDYLEVRPERRDTLAARLVDQRLEAGPWYVLADTLIPSGEALVRNLLAGRALLRRLGATSPPVLYCPDSFGHPAALPALAAGFGLPVIVLWRGFGGRRWPNTDRFVWRGNGETALAYHLPPSGYEVGASLPVGAAASVERWDTLRASLVGRARGDVVLLPNGADHHARQHDQPAAVAALARAAERTGDDLRPSSLRTFADALVVDVREARLPVLDGELRDSYGFTWTLGGTLAARAAQKRRNARVERLLVRDTEPWAALARTAGGSDRAPLLTAAWRTLLRAHPHDTLCGCSIDAVAAAMDRRLADARAQAAGVRDDSLAEIVGFDPERARAHPARWQPSLVIRNPAPRARGGVALVELEQFVAHVPVGPGSARPPRSNRDTPEVENAPELKAPCQPLGSRRVHRRTESPRHYPDNDLVEITRAAVWCPPIGGYGTRSVALESSSTSSGDRPLVSSDATFGDAEETRVANPVLVSDSALENSLMQVHVAKDGTIRVVDAGSGRTIESLVVFEDRTDRGDLYTPSIGDIAASARFAGVRTIHRGPLVGELRLTWRLDALGEDPHRRRARKRVRSSRGTRGTVTVGVRLVADSPALHLRVAGVNRASDHRLRVGIRTGLAHAAVWADAAFGAIRRRPLTGVTDEDRAMETPVSTAPLHRYVSLFAAGMGATVFSDGLAEYEATDDGTVFVTLLRSVGQLSRNDIAERPGHAGWPSPTPAAQSTGPFTANLAVMLHGDREPAVVDAIERCADDVLLPLSGATLRATLAVPLPTTGVELSGDGLAFVAMKPSDDGTWTVLRCVNLLESAVHGRWALSTPLEAARRSRLDESLVDVLTVDGNEVRFTAQPREVVTILVR